MLKTGFDLDVSYLEKMFVRLSNEEENKKIAASAALAGAVIVRDEARARAPVDSGKLQEAIYVAHDTNNSNATLQSYVVSWNSKKAPHGHLIEFGHWLVKGGNRIKWVSGKSFLRSAYEAKKEQATRRMQEIANKKVRELIDGSTTERSS